MEGLCVGRGVWVVVCGGVCVEGLCVILQLCSWMLIFTSSNGNVCVKTPPLPLFLPQRRLRTVRRMRTGSAG